MRRPVPVVLATFALAAAVSACGTQDNAVLSSNASADVKNGAQLFVQRCASCHTLSKVGAQGSAFKVSDRERVDGPNFNERKECVENVLYAIRNGGYSGAIMPENLVVGEQAQDVAVFLQQYSGLKREATVGTQALSCPGG